MNALLFNTVLTEILLPVVRITAISSKSGREKNCCYRAGFAIFPANISPVSNFAILSCLAAVRILVMSSPPLSRSLVYRMRISNRHCGSKPGVTNARKRVQVNLKRPFSYARHVTNALIQTFTYNLCIFGIHRYYILIDFWRHT